MQGIALTCKTVAFKNVLFEFVKIVTYLNVSVVICSV